MIGQVTLKGKYCCEDVKKIQNYQTALEDKNNSWQIHHRLETHTSDGIKRLVQLSVKELIALDMYYNRPANELIFLSVSEHRKLHGEGYTKEPHSKECKQKISKSVKEYYSKHERVMPKETIKKVQEGVFKYYQSTKGIKQARTHSEIMSKKRWYNNGTISVMKEECPIGFVAGRIMKKRSRYKRG